MAVTQINRRKSKNKVNSKLANQTKKLGNLGTYPKPKAEENKD